MKCGNALPYKLLYICFCYHSSYFYEFKKLVKYLNELNLESLPSNTFSIDSELGPVKIRIFLVVSTHALKLAEYFKFLGCPSKDHPLF